MKKYRTYTAKKFKIWKKILFFVIVAIAIFVFSIILGNHLKNKLENTDVDTSKIEETTDHKENNSSEDKEKGVAHDEALAGVKAGYLDLSGVTDAKGAYSAVDALRSQGFNAVSFLVTDGEGKITYGSPAVEEASRLSSSEALIPFSVVKSAVYKAQSNGMRSCAVIEASDSLSDELLAKELSEAGFDEIIIRGFEDYTQLDNNAVSEITGYVKKLRQVCDEKTAISVSFYADFYKSAKNAPYIEKIYLTTHFLSIDLTGLSADEVSAVCTDISGSFSAYLLRPILDGDNAELRDGVNASLEGASVAARQYISAVKSADDTTDDED